MMEACFLHLKIGHFKIEFKGSPFRQKKVYPVVPDKTIYGCLIAKFDPEKNE
ncbi:hypothetical protein P872_18975 [Rhodonellum psychrophilum GCM71 = DSM 17998]|uniref:Uncharacterized protein n=1 Tax=Rhodonellum psychrophilum GCM71 = DSM 17998 TaxID=1123057 RepID=U5BWM1_9BACT|nr:hypothetical protein P872_18975 [Rhodonellum psychrophilum GCM71 = DSM 17998]